MVNTHGMIPVDQLQNLKLIEYAQRVTPFLQKLGYWSSIDSIVLAWGVSDIVAVFFVQVTPKRLEIDDRIWVVVGDLPPAYFVCDNINDWQEALGAYVDEMGKWVEAVLECRSIQHLIPVNVAPTIEHANMLKSRLQLLRDSYIDKPKEDMPTDR